MKFINFVYNKDFDAIRTAFTNGENLDDVDKNGRSALIHAVLQKNEPMVRFLLNLGANPNIQDIQGYTSLHYASQEYVPDIVEELLDYKAKVDIQDQHGNTPLFRAVFNSNGRGEVISLLLRANANINTINKYGISPIELAKSISNYNIKQFFAE